MSCHKRFCGLCSRQLFHTIHSNKWLHKTRTIITTPKSASTLTSQENTHLAQIDNGETTKRSSKILRVSIVGSPNAGKSTLLNCFFPSKQQIAAVSSKYNTTREQYRGVFTDKERQVQIIFTDTPGIVEQAENRKRYFRSLVTEAIDSIDEESIDAVLLVVDAAAKLSTRRRKSLLKVRDLCIEQNLDLFLILNKIDYIRNKRELLPLTNTINELLQYEKINTMITSGERKGGHKHMQNNIKYKLLHTSL